MSTATRCLFIHPKFQGPSFWNYRETCSLVDARYPAAPLGLVTVAGMLPQEWDIRLVDRNVEELDPALFDWADLVMIGGMMPQQADSVEMIRSAKARGRTVIVGGPDATSSPHVYREADHLVLGEAELTLPPFLEDLKNGCPKPTYEAPGLAPMDVSPVPRFDLLKLDKYLHVGIQWGRGCPFSCEFCDIIELFGQRPRAKTNDQMIKELQALYDLGYRGHVDLVDDNFIGYKKLVKGFLPDLLAWLNQHKWPFEFTTEASINLAKDKELLKMMRQVGFSSVFIGIETPDRETLIDIQKRQNTGMDEAEAVKRIHEHGMFVNAGFILGFDGDKAGAADAIINCAMDAAIPASMVGLLFALPNTQLSRRLKREGRLPDGFEVAEYEGGDQCTAGLNFDPARPRIEILRDYLKVVETLYSPANYFARVLKVGQQMNASGKKLNLPLGKRIKELRGFFRLIRRMGFNRHTGRHFWRVLLRVAVTNPLALRYVIAMMALYLHFGQFSRYVGGLIRKEIDREIAEPTRVAKVVRAVSTAGSGAM